MRFSSLALRRHLERLAPSRAVTSGLPNITPRISSSALQHLQVRQPFFSTPTFGRSAVKSVPSSTEAHSQGLATLSVSVLLSQLTLGSLFQLPTLLGFALQSFSPPQGS